MFRPSLILLRKRRNQVPEMRDFFSTPGASKTFQSHGCGLISMSVIARDSFKFKKRCQFFVGTHNEPFSVVAMRVCNPDLSPVGIHG
jgi:hypothetical protein